MAKPAELEKLTGIASRFGAFIAERHPFALSDAIDAWEAVAGGRELNGEAAIETLRPALGRELAKRLKAHALPQGGGETTPRTSASQRLEQAHATLMDECDGFLRRAAIEASLAREERVAILRGMILTRGTDNRLQALFLRGELRAGTKCLQTKALRALGQEAIYGAAIRLRRGRRHREANGRWQGDVIGP